LAGLFAAASKAFIFLIYFLRTFFSALAYVTAILITLTVALANDFLAALSLALISYFSSSEAFLNFFVRTKTFLAT
jgi:hypothetical protein